MRRFAPLLRKVALSLAAGAAVTIAFAWARAATVDLRRSWTCSGWIPDRRLGKSLIWGVGRIDFPGGSLVFALPENVIPPDASPPPTPIRGLVPAWCALLESMTMTADGSLDEREPFHSAYFKEAGFGWPAIAVVAAWEDNRLKAGISLPAANGQTRALPTRVLPAGLAIDTAVFATVVGLGWAGTQRCIRWRRSRLGRCRECGYDLRRSDRRRCPECGDVPEVPSDAV